MRSGSGIRSLMTFWSWFGLVHGGTRLLAAAYDSKVFFTVVGKGPLEVKTADVYAFV